MAAPENSDAPVWARPEAFPAAPDGWGWVDPKDGLHPCKSLQALEAVVREDRSSRVCLVWSPENPRMIIPEDAPWLSSALLTARSQWVREDLDDATGKLRWALLGFGALFAYVFYSQMVIRSSRELPLLAELRLSLRGTLNTTIVEAGLMIIVLFAIIPWFQARKSFADLAKWSGGRMGHAIPAIRFEIWLERQKAPITRYFLGVITLVGIAQLLATDGITAAGLVTHAGLLRGVTGAAEWWRFLTGPFLHGNPIHFAMNAAALLYLGKRLEVFARWPHLALVFVVSAYAAGQASFHFASANFSVGASGGLMGWLGFLLVFETLHGRLVPRSARRRLVAAVALTGVIGLLGYRFIDNAAHAGGLIAGMLYAVIVFPKSASVYRPKPNTTDYAAGLAALALITACALFAVWKVAVA